MSTASHFTDGIQKLGIEMLPMAALLLRGSQVVALNAPAQDLLNIDVGADFWAQFTPPCTSELRPVWDRLLADPRAGFAEVQLWRSDMDRPMGVELSVLQRPDGLVQVILHSEAARRHLMREQLRAQIAEEANLALQREIEERKRVEAQLAQAQLYASRIIESSLDMIVATDNEHLINEFNSAAERTFGYSKAELVGKHIELLFSDPAERENVLDVIARDGFFANEIVNRRKDGSLFISFLSASEIKDEDGRVIGAMGVSRDITSIKKAEEELRLSEERHRALYDQAYIGIARIAKIGRFIMVNQRLCNMLGYSPEELYRKTFYQLLEESEVADCLLDWDNLLSGRLENFSREQTYLHKDGHMIKANVTVTLVRDASNNPNYFVGVFEDITQRKEYEQRLKESLKEKEVLLKEVHHRVKNNMQVISSILNLQSGYITDPATLTMLRESQDRIKSMSFIHESLYQSKNLAAVNFSQYLRNITRNLFHSYLRPQGGLDIVYDLEDVELGLDNAIPCGLIINELVSNAFKYAFQGRDRGQISVGLQRVDESLRLTIADDGVGLPPGFDIETTETLGLQLVTTLVSQLRGDLTIDGSNGCRFVIEFSEV